jgi:hypothetical protein
VVNRYNIEKIEGDAITVAAWIILSGIAHSQGQTEKPQYRRRRSKLKPTDQPRLAKSSMVDGHTFEYASTAS